MQTTQIITGFLITGLLLSGCGKKTLDGLYENNHEQDHSYDSLKFSPGRKVDVKFPDSMPRPVTYSIDGDRVQLNIGSANAHDLKIRDDSCLVGIKETHTSGVYCKEE